MTTTIISSQLECWKATRALLLQAWKHHKRAAQGGVPFGPPRPYFMRVRGAGLSTATTVNTILANYAPKEPPTRRSVGADMRELGLSPSDRALAWALFRAGYTPTEPPLRMRGWDPPSL